MENRGDKSSDISKNEKFPKNESNENGYTNSENKKNQHLDKFDNNKENPPDMLVSEIVKGDPIYALEAGLEIDPDTGLVVGSQIVRKVVVGHSTHTETVATPRDDGKGDYKNYINPDYNKDELSKKIDKQNKYFDESNELMDIPEKESTVDLTSPEAVIALMESSKDEKEWNANCDRVIAANGGDYPSFWLKEIVISGIVQRTQEKWKK
ncbi:MAG: hypothetical protein WCP14_00195 [bacterium]